MSMAERRLFKVVKDGLQFFVDNPAALEQWAIDSLEMEAAEAAKLRLFFAGGTNPDDGAVVPGQPPVLVHGYPRVDGPFPCWALTLGAESIEQDYLGKDAPFLDSDGDRFYDARTGDVVTPQARRLQYRFNFLVIVDHPDITVSYYHLLKHILMSNQRELEKSDVEDLAFTGADMAPDPRYLPHDVFARILTVTVSGDETWCEDMPKAYANAIRGIHADDTGEGVTSGGVAASAVAKVTVNTGS